MTLALVAVLVLTTEVQALLFLPLLLLAWRRDATVPGRPERPPDAPTRRPLRCRPAVRAALPAVRAPRALPVTVAALGAGPRRS